MPVPVTRGRTDPTVEAVRGVLEQYLLDHPKTSAELYRRDGVTIRLRVVDARFNKMDLYDRTAYVRNYLKDRLPAEVMAQVFGILAVTPRQARTEIGKLEFDDPLPAPAGR